MRTWDLNTPSARLRQALKDLNLVRGRLGDDWQDETFREFQEAFLEPLEPKIRRALLAIGELTEVLLQAEKACGSY